jgi:hypothetical protein
MIFFKLQNQGKLKKLTKIAFLALLLLNSVPLHAGSSKLNESNALLLPHFRLWQHSSFQNAHGFNSSFSFGISFNPELILNNNWSIVSSLGGFPILRRSTDTTFFGAQASLYLKLNISPLIIEAGPGTEIWLVQPSIILAAPTLSGNIHYQFSDRLLSVFDTVFLGYTAAFFEPYTHEIKIGTQIVF